MKTTPLWPMLIGLTLASAGLPTLAQTTVAAAAAPVTRQQIRMQRDEFLKTHRWDEASGLWTLRPGVEPPPGIKSRALVMAERDEFLRAHQWDDAQGWLPVPGTTRDLGNRSREQVRAETRAFLATHVWDEPTEKWVMRAERRPKS